MKKILILLLALSFCIPLLNMQVARAEIPNTIRAIYSNINVYSLPNINDEENIIIATYNYNYKFNTLGEDSILGEDGFEYYKVEINVTPYAFGYVFKSQTCDDKISSPQKKLDSNAVTISECDIYILNGNNYEKTLEKLNANEQIKIISGYNKVNEFTQIQYKSNDGEIVTAYIKTSAIKTSGISRTLIGTIIIIITTISLLLIIFGIKGKKTKKNK